MRNRSSLPARARCRIAGVPTALDEAGAGCILHPGATTELHCLSLSLPHRCAHREVLALACLAALAFQESRFRLPRVDPLSSIDLDVIREPRLRSGKPVGWDRISLTC